MGHELRLPKVDQNITEVFVVRWLKAVGERVSLEEPILEVTSDKANIEIVATAAGILEEQCYFEEERVRVGDVFAVLSDAEEAGTK
ncbi:MAG: hypothetical protein IPI73_01410 [Betaproteobacteria bacterium]|nr:hypothetical protein [Betaproteobacteria bacterium]MBK8739122.1 hypothetical protein [Betaproteobacteria bacterium]